MYKMYRQIKVVSSLVYIVD